MRYFSLFAAIAVAGLMALPASAQPPRERGERPNREQLRERMLKEFDKDGDGKLSDEERQAAREAMRERFGRRGRDGRRDAGGAERPPVGMPRLTALFDKFDADGDGQLSREEFTALVQFVRSQGGLGQGPRVDGRRAEGGAPRGEGFRPRRADGERQPRGERPDGERRRPQRDAAPDDAT